MSLLGSDLSHEMRFGSLQLLPQVKQLKIQDESGRRGSGKVTHEAKVLTLLEPAIWT